MTLELEVDVDRLTDGGIKGMPTWVKLNDEDGERTSTVYVNTSSYWHVVDENAKLRELARDVNKAAHMLCEAWEGSCSKEAEGMSLHAVCPISDTNELCVFGKLYDRVRELGVDE